MSQAPQRRPQDRGDENSDDGGEKNSAFSGDDSDPFEIGAGRRWTGNITILVHEARLAARGETVENPAMPITARVAEKAQARIDAEDFDGELIGSEIEDYPTTTEVVLDGE